MTGELWILGLVMAGVAVLAIKSSAAVKSENPELLGIVQKYADKYGIDAALIKAVIQNESSWDPQNRNPADPSYGLMGITPQLAQDFGIVKDWQNPTAAEIARIYDPDTNIMIGAGHLSDLLGSYDFDTAIQMYNVGISGFIVYGYRNAGYLAAVTDYYNQYLAEGS